MESTQPQPDASESEIVALMERMAAAYERDTSLSALWTLDAEKLAAEAMRRLAGRA